MEIRNVLVLEKNECCPYVSKCRYSSGCWGTRSDRGTRFTCEFAKEFFEPKPPLGRTGKMTILLEDKNG